MSEELRPYTPSWSEAIKGKLMDALMGAGASKGYASDFGDKASTIAGFLPGVGNALSANDAYRAFGAGHTFAGAMSVLGAVPLPGAAIEGAVERELPRIGNPIIAYHGSPYKFDQFDASKIGTGEGAQAYGHGLYFSDNEDVARSYRDELSGKRVMINGEEFAHSGPVGIANIGTDPKRQAAYWLATGMSPAEVKSAAYRIGPSHKDGNAWAKNVSDAAKELAVQSPTLAPAGHMYQVAIHADPEGFLDWDKPLSKQHPNIREFIEHHADARRLTGNAFTGGQLSEPTGQDIFNRMSGLRTPEMQSAGIPGIRYLDQGSRSAGEGSHNYVVFDPSHIEIMRRYGLAGLGGSAGAGILMNPPDQSNQQPGFY